MSNVLSPAKRKRTSHGWSAKAKSRTESASTFKDPSSEALKKLEDIYNPFDDMPVDKLKPIALHMFFSCQVSWPCFPIKREDVYALVATNLSMSAKTIQKWILEFEKEGFFTESQRGKNSKPSPMHDSSFR